MVRCLDKRMVNPSIDKHGLTTVWALRNGVGIGNHLFGWVQCLLHLLEKGFYTSQTFVGAGNRALDPPIAALWRVNSLFRETVFVPEADAHPVMKAIQQACNGNLEK